METLASPQPLQDVGILLDKLFERGTERRAQKRDILGMLRVENSPKKVAQPVGAFSISEHRFAI